MELNDTQLDLFKSLLNSLSNILLPLFSKFLQNEINVTLKKEKKELLSKLDNLIKKEQYIIISASHSKKILKNLGFSPLKLIVSGGPILINDYIKVNPNLSEKDLQGISKKSKNLISKLQKIARSDSDITFIFEKNNRTDQVILEELNEIKKKIGKAIFVFEIPNWRKLEF